MASLDTRQKLSGQVKSLATSQTMITESDTQCGDHDTPVPERTEIQHLPNELLCAVFECGASSVEDTPADCAAVAFEVTVSHVSSHWRDVALSNPLLWTTVHVSHQRPIEQALVYLQRSKSYLVDITVDVRNYVHADPRYAIDALADYVDRWRRFVLKTKTCLDFMPLVMRFLDGYAPHLEYLQLYTSYKQRDAEEFIGADIFTGGLPRLSSLRLAGIYVPLSKSSLSQISFLDLAFPAEPCLSYRKLHSILVDCDSLERLVLRGDLSMYSVEPNLYIPLPSLLSLEMDITSAGSFCMLLETSALQRLDVEASSLSQREIAKFLSSFWLSSGSPRYPNLQTLKMRNFEEGDLHGIMNNHFMLSLPRIKSFGLTPTRCDEFLRLLKETVFAGDGSPDLLWPDLHVLDLHSVGSRLLQEFVTARIEAGHPLSELKIGHSSVDRETATWVKKSRVNLLYHGSEHDYIAPDLSDVGWSTDEDEENDWDDLEDD